MPVCAGWLSSGDISWTRLRVCWGLQRATTPTRRNSFRFASLNCGFQISHFLLTPTFLSNPCTLCGSNLCVFQCISVFHVILIPEFIWMKRLVVLVVSHFKVGFDPIIEHRMMAGCDVLLMPSQCQHHCTPNLRKSIKKAFKKLKNTFPEA